MNAPAHDRLRRGACPGLSAPMVTGDGLLARLVPAGTTIPLDAFAGLCAAAQKYGNGVIEITSRGSIQVRGLSAASASLFAADVAALGIDASDGIPVIVDPLSGLSQHDRLDVNAVATQMRKALAAKLLVESLSAKVSVAMDGGGALHLDSLPADVRLRAVGGGHVHVAVAGDAEAAIPLGAVAVDRAVDCVVRLFETLAATASRSRMRDAIEGEGLDAFKSAVSGYLVDFPVPGVRRAADPVGVHRLSHGNAVGVGLPFGHSNAEALSRLMAAARDTGAAGVRTAPGRALLLVGIGPGVTQKLVREAGALGFVGDPADPRRRVVACAGAPICASGEIPVRAMAPAIAEAARVLPDGDFVHVSGCGKGCAHPAPTPLAVFGRSRGCDVFVDGERAGSLKADDLPTHLAELFALRKASR